MAQRRMKSARSNFADGMKAAKQVRTDLAWTQKRVSSVHFLSIFPAPELGISFNGSVIPPATSAFAAMIISTANRRS